MSSAVPIAGHSEIVFQAEDYTVVKAESPDAAETSQGILKRKKTRVKSNAKPISAYSRRKAAEALMAVTSIAPLTEKDLRPDAESAPEVETLKQKKRKQSDDVDVGSSNEKSTLSSAKPRFPCDLCDRDYARKDKLRQHRRSHTGEKPYNCSHCDKSFFRRDKCVIHERSHTGERPYECEFCDATFARSDKRQHHVARIHYGGSPKRKGRKTTVEKEAQKSGRKKATVTAETVLETDIVSEVKSEAGTSEEKDGNSEDSEVEEVQK